MREHAASLWRRGQHGWPDAYPLVQFPNLPLLIAIVAAIAEAVQLFGTVDPWRVIYVVGIVAWAVLEIARGANLFRRLLGAVVLGWLVVGLAGVR